MTAAATTLKIQRSRYRGHMRIRIRSSLHDFLLTPTPFHSRTANESGATGKLFTQGIGTRCTIRLRSLELMHTTIATTATTLSPPSKQIELVPESAESFRSGLRSAPASLESLGRERSRREM
ncbi:hypothetical protein PILCRDRAFT_829309 [Piloderma croceum F 1598]|uniref:Uncharacterized protein n=1 Tax=Piloderma croceum (strain F 1598) TaxID=765440 RepID=A0A0C3EZU9_PILCF|nr:hypothetical protein PILCRDRAFT_829309 [Piloderma croceum F 1598]